ncbi:unnamed protein product [Brachionus calyciflorus]|uniref:Virilizer N-terminal domain-containing protein n=1 Tax=Brachionus calyciflorus TaxID=104777 RepID=A0A813R8J8_9BILA|nr:unnamed protein product [Brachionus calyciflorus]
MTDGPTHQEILFIDDFNHQNSDSVHWDHIKFAHPVYIEQIRIIPDNCLIQLKNGVSHRGSTSPKKFRIELYSNNLNKKDQECATLDRYGSLTYDDESPSDPISSYILKPSNIPLDWLVITGSYSSLSIAVTGVKVRNNLPTIFPIINNTSLLPVSNTIGLPRQMNLRFPVIRPQVYPQRHHPYIKPVQQIVKPEPEVKEELIEETKIDAELSENSEVPDDDIPESSIVKYYLNLDETRDELEVIEQHNFKNENLKLNFSFDPYEFRLENKPKKPRQTLDGINFDLEYLVENLDESLVEYVPKFRSQIQQILVDSTKNLKNFNLILKLCKKLHENYSSIFMIDEQLDLANLLVDLIVHESVSKYTFQLNLFKLVYMLNLVLNSAKAVDNFVHKSYEKFLRHFHCENTRPIGSKLTFIIGRILLKIQFYQNLKNLNEFCDKIDELSTQMEKLISTYESINIYALENLRIEDSMLNPIQSIFSTKTIENYEIFTFFEQTNFFKNSLILWSLGHKSLVDLIENFFENFFLPSVYNAHTHTGIEYLLNRPQITNCILQICLKNSEKVKSKIALKISYSVYILNLLESLIEDFESLKQNDLNRVFLMVNNVQEMDFLLSENIQTGFIVDFLSEPDGNFNNKYFKVLVDFFEYLIEDNFESDLRCYAMNSITNILCNLINTNLNWTIVDPKEYTHIKKLNKLMSNLINKLIMTSLKPSTDENKSYFKLINKLNKIMSIIEPFFSFKDTEKNFLNFIIDSFREQIDKNLNIYLSKYVLNSSQCLNYLNSNLTHLILLKNTLNYGQNNLNSNKLNKKILLGNLINRNLCHVLINFLARLSDYIKFYRDKCDLKQSNKLRILIDYSIWLIKIIVLNLFKVQEKKFNDFYIVEILLEFYPMVQHVIKKCENIETNLIEIFSAYAKYRPIKFFDTLSKNLIKKPENFVLGLNILNHCVKLTKIPELKPLFKHDAHNYLIEEAIFKGSNFVNMLRTLCLSSLLSEEFLEFSAKMTSEDFLKVFIDYSIELIGEIKSNFNLNEVELYQKQAEPIKEDFLYDTNLVEIQPEDEKNADNDAQNENLNEFKILLIKKITLVTKFLINYLNLIDKSLFISLIKSNNICPSSFLSSNINYAQYIPNLLRYFNQIDFNLKSCKSLRDLAQVQEAILDLSLFLIEDLDQFELTKILIDHLGMTRLDNFNVTLKVLNCLLKIKNPNDILELHFLNPKYLIDFINELAGKLKNFNLYESTEILSKFFQYSKLLINCLVSRNETKKIWNLFEWTVKNSNDSLIDSISMSSSISNGNLLHCLYNLDKNIESFFKNLLDDESRKKFKLILNQSNNFLKFLNEFDERSLGLFGFESKKDGEKLIKDNFDFDFNFELNESIELILMSDKDLYKRLKLNVEEFQTQICEDQEDMKTPRAKSEIINTRTGVRYKAPMRGGHVSTSTRLITGLTSSVSVPSIPLLANTPSNSNLTRIDSFRTRPQNTSRPPSLHVDDFYRMEQQQKQMSVNNENGPSDNLSQITRNNSLNDLNYQMNNNSNNNNQDELSVQTGEIVQSNFNVVSPQVKPNMIPNLTSPISNGNQQNSSQFMNHLNQQPLIKTPPITNQFNTNRQIMGFSHMGNDMNRQQQQQYQQFNNGQDMNNGLLYVNNQNMNENIPQSPLSPNQMNQQMMINQVQNQQHQQMSSVMMQGFNNNNNNNNYRFGQTSHNRGGGHSMQHSNMFRGGMRRGITTSNISQISPNQNYSNGNNFIRPTYPSNSQIQNQYQQHQR